MTTGAAFILVCALAGTLALVVKQVVDIRSLRSRLAYVQEARQGASDQWGSTQRELRALKREHARTIADLDGFQRVLAHVRARGLMSEMEIARVMLDEADEEE